MPFIKGITSEEERIYRKVLEAYQREDAIYFADNFCWEDYDLTEEEQRIIWDRIDFDYLVNEFNERCDMEVGDFYTWDNIIHRHIEGLIDELEAEKEN